MGILCTPSLAVRMTGILSSTLHIGCLHGKSGPCPTRQRLQQAQNVVRGTAAAAC